MGNILRVIPGRYPAGPGIALVLLPIISLLWPLDATWINDEPRLIALALQANQEGILPAHGIMGSKGIFYGPFPLWFYSLVLRFTPDISAIVAVRAVLVSIITAVSIIWLASSIRQLKAWMGGLAVFSPYLWIYSRPLWDNTFLIPLSAITISAYVSFCVRPGIWKIWLVIAGITSMFLTHLMCASLVLPLVLHFAWFHGKWVIKEWKALVWPVAASGMVSYGYIAYLLSINWAVMAGNPEAVSLKGFLILFTGGQFFSAWGLDYFFGADWLPNAYLPLVLLSWTAMIAVPVGMGVALWRLRKQWNKGGRWDVRSQMSILALGMVSANSLLCGFSRSFGHPHYYNATWFACYYFLWTALSVEFRSGAVKRMFNWLIGAYSVSMAVILGTIIWNMHASGGNQLASWGPSLRTQIDVVRKLDAYDASSRITSTVPNYVLFPHSLAVLRYIYGSGEPGRRSVGNIVIAPKYPGTRQGWLTLEEQKE